MADPVPTVKCAVCLEGEAKYRCPGCLIRTCALPCVQRHKKETQCTGQRNKTAYISVQNFTDRDLCSDLQFLEEGCRKAWVMKNERVKQDSFKISLNQKSMVRKARHRGAELITMPRGMSRHLQNSSIFDHENKIMHWRVEWKFPQEDLTFTDDRFSDAELIEDGVDRHLQHHNERTRRLHQYTAEAGQQYRVFLRVHGLQDEVRYYELDKKISLYQNLSGKRILEFPTLLIVPENASHSYTILSSDEAERLPKLSKPAQWKNSNRNGGRRGRFWFRRGRGRGRGRPQHNQN